MTWLKKLTQVFQLEKKLYIQGNFKRWLFSVPRDWVEKQKQLYTLKHDRDLLYQNNISVIKFNRMGKIWFKGHHMLLLILF